MNGPWPDEANHTPQPGDSPNDLIAEGLDGMMKLLQGLVIALQQSGSMDTAYYARLLVSMRGDEKANSMQEALIDRMLMMLVDDPQTLVRRMAIRAVPDTDTDTDTEGGASDPPP